MENKKIEWFLISQKIEFEKEKVLIKGRKFRCDFFVSSLNLVIEYEGIMSNKSRHTSKVGYSKDCEKYNLLSMAGYTVLRYTVLNISNLQNDIKKLQDDKTT